MSFIVFCKVIYFTKLIKLRLRLQKRNCSCEIEPLGRMLVKKLHLESVQLAYLYSIDIVTV